MSSNKGPGAPSQIPSFSKLVTGWAKSAGSSGWPPLYGPVRGGPVRDDSLSTSDARVLATALVGQLTPDDFFQFWMDAFGDDYAGCVRHDEPEQLGTRYTFEFVGSHAPLPAKPDARQMHAWRSRENLNGELEAGSAPTFLPSVIDLRHGWTGGEWSGKAMQFLQEYVRWTGWCRSSGNLGAPVFRAVKAEAREADLASYMVADIVRPMAVRQVAAGLKLKLPALVEEGLEKAEAVWEEREAKRKAEAALDAVLPRDGAVPVPFAVEDDEES